MLKAYSYKPEHFGMKEFPSGTLRLQGTEAVEDPTKADVFIIPPSLMHLKDEDQHPNNPRKDASKYLNRLPYWGENGERHVAFDVSDFDTVYNSKAILIRCNVKPHMRKADPNTISWAWPVENYQECVDLPEGGFKYDVSFHAWISTETRRLSGLSCQNSQELKCDIAMYKDFTGYIYHEPEGIRRRAEFRRSMRESRVSLCPESIPGVFPYRFFEAMSAGRVPLLVASDYELPFQDLIPYDVFTLFCSRANAHQANCVIEQYLGRLRKHWAEPDVEIKRMGQVARDYWLKFLNRDDWPTMMTWAVERKLHSLGLYDGPISPMR